MNKLKIAWEVEYKKDTKSILEAFGTNGEEIQNLIDKRYKVSKENGFNATDLLVYLLEEELISEAVGFSLLSIGLQVI